MKIEQTGAEVTNDCGSQTFTFTSVINKIEYQTACIVCSMDDAGEFDFMRSVVESVVKQFEDFKEKLSKVE